VRHRTQGLRGDVDFITLYVCERQPDLIEASLRNVTSVELLDRILAAIPVSSAARGKLRRAARWPFGTDVISSADDDATRRAAACADRVFNALTRARQPRLSTISPRASTTKE